MCANGTHWQPGPGTSWNWQLEGTVDTSYDVQALDIDMFDATTALIQTIHQSGKAAICYIDTAYEPDRPDSSEFPASVKGNEMDGWPGEYWVDIRSTIVRNIMAARIALAASKACDALEMDDVDAYENNPGFPLTAADQADFNTFLATTAHSLSLGIALKNDLDQVTTLIGSFDFAINEQCNEYDECNMVQPFITAGKAVFNAEYNLATSQFCPQMITDKFSSLLKNIDLTAAYTACCTTCTGTITCVPDSQTKRSVPAEEEVRHANIANSGSTITGFVCILGIVLLVALL